MAMRDGYAVAAQAIFYGMAWADSRLSGQGVLKRLTSPARTFTVLMAASLCAAVILFMPGRDLWKQTQVGGDRPAG